MSLAEDIRGLQSTVREQGLEIDALKATSSTFNEQINGERGISSAINKQTGEITSLRKAAYWVAGLIVAGAITFAFSVLTVFAPGT